MATPRVKVDATDVVIHRTTSLPRSHIVRRSDGIRLTKTARAVLDEARHREPLPLESLIEDAINQGRCTAQTLRSVASEMAGRGRRGTALLNEVLRGRPAWRRPVDSHPELVLHAALRRAGLELATQPSLQLPDGRTIHPDLGEPDISFYVEIDDHAWHGGRQRTTRDNIRDRQAELGGAKVIRVGTDEIEHRLDALVDEIVDLYRLRRRHILGTHAA
jgi:very-short-patch-repair endonuclease